MPVVPPSGRSLPLRRRALLSGGLATLGTLAVGSAAGGERLVPRRDLRRVDVELPGRDGTRQARILAPTHGRPGERFPAVVLLHGLGETRSQALGLRAWPELYGLEPAYEGLRRPPLAATGGGRYFTAAHRQALNASLAAAPFGGLVCVCPVTPNARKAKDPSATLDDYARWIVEVLLPEVGRHAPLSGVVGLDGVSLGGYVALEVFTRRPKAFRSLGGVQAAFGPERVGEYTERLAAALKDRGPVPLHLQTSSEDPFRRANELLGRELSAGGVAADVEVLPGPHDQHWLREVGTMAMLRWQERALGG